LITAFRNVGQSDALGIVLAGIGPVFSAGHDFADVADADLSAVRSLLVTCTELMTLIQQVPQPVVARVHGLAAAAGCQLVATADLAVASENAGFAAPGGRGGWFFHTPMVAIARNIDRKRATEMALAGDVVDARTALDWGLVNGVVPAEQLDSAVQDLLERVTLGSAESKGIGKQALYAQIDLDQPKAYAYAVEVMAATASCRTRVRGCGHSSTSASPSGATGGREDQRYPSVLAGRWGRRPRPGCAGRVAGISAAQRVRRWAAAVRPQLLNEDRPAAAGAPQ